MQMLAGELVANQPVPDVAFGPDYYHTIYRHYERQNPSYKRGFYRDLVFKHAGSQPARILDVGCAFGGFLAWMPDTWDRFGIDVSSFAIQRGERAHSGLHLAAATLDTNPFSGPFDVVTSFDVIEHIENLETVAASIDKLLKPGGLFVFVVPTYDGPLGPVVHLLDRDPTHIHKTNRKFWLDWAARHFEVQEWMGAYRMLLPRGPYIHWPTRALRAFAPAIVVVAKARRKA
jgi:SAM-dependent methyltransferase